MLGSPTRRGSFFRCCALLACLAPLLCACATAARAPVVTVEQRIAEARAEGLALEDPLAIDDEMKAAVDRVVSRAAEPGARLVHLARYLTDAGFVNFQYLQNQSLTAKRAFRERRGDCMAYTNLFMALARYLGVDAYFVHVRDVQNYYEHRGMFFVSSHVAVGYGTGPTAEVVDFSRAITDWKLALYRTISDDAALALYYNNVAVDQMQSGRNRDAERLFRFWLTREPGVAELYNNLGVLLNRELRHEEALALLQEGARRFPTYAPLYTNGLRAAHGANRLDAAADLERRGQDLEQTDPFFIFARAMNLYHGDHYSQAAVELERALREKPDSPVIVAWLARAYLAAGRRAEGLAMVERAKAMAPPGPLLRALRRQFPDLAAAP